MPISQCVNMPINYTHWHIGTLAHLRNYAQNNRWQSHFGTNKERNC